MLVISSIRVINGFSSNAFEYVLYADGELVAEKRFRNVKPPEMIRASFKFTAEDSVTLRLEEDV